MTLDIPIDGFDTIFPETLTMNMATNCNQASMKHTTLLPEKPPGKGFA